MDGSSPNDGLQNQNTPENANGYQQYLDPASKPSKRRKFIIFSGIGLLVIIILTAVALALGHNKKNNQSQSTQTPQAATCSDDSCFVQNFSSCTQTSSYTYKQPDSTIKYTITGKEDAGCTLGTEYVNGSLGADAVGKTMTCEFDNSIDFKDAYQNVFRFPDDYDCTGNLADLVKSLNQQSANTE